MTGRELIIYILENKLEDTEIFGKKGLNFKALGFMSAYEAAAKFNVGPSTILMWYKMGMLDGIYTGDTIYFPKNAEDPRLAK